MLKFLIEQNVNILDEDMNINDDFYKPIDYFKVVSTGRHFLRTVKIPMLIQLATCNQVKATVEEMISIRDRCRHRLSDVQSAGPEATLGHLLCQPMAHSVN